MVLRRLIHGHRSERKRKMVAYIRVGLVTAGKVTAVHPRVSGRVVYVQYRHHDLGAGST
jgi:hypothetical protein